MAEFVGKHAKEDRDNISDPEQSLGRGAVDPEGGPHPGEKENEGEVDSHLRPRNFRNRKGPGHQDASGVVDGSGVSEAPPKNRHILIPLLI